LHRFDGFLLPQPAEVFHSASDPGVHRVSGCCETAIPACATLPFEAFPPSVATAPCVAAAYRGENVRAGIPCRRNLHHSPFPSRPWEHPAGCFHLPKTPEPQGFSPRSGSVARARRFQRVEPGAPLGFDRSRPQGSRREPYSRRRTRC
jgi:hypothetical protein